MPPASPSTSCPRCGSRQLEESKGGTVYVCRLCQHEFERGTPPAPQGPVAQRPESVNRGLNTPMGSPTQLDLGLPRTIPRTPNLPRPLSRTPTAYEAAPQAPAGSTDGVEEQIETMRDPWYRKPSVPPWVSGLWPPVGRWVTVLLAVYFVVGMAFYTHAERIYHGVAEVLGRAPQVRIVQTPGTALRIIRARSVLYTLASGQQALVVQGDVRNESQMPHRRPDVQLQVLDETGAAVGEAHSPVGFVPSLAELHRLTPDGWEQLVAQARRPDAPPVAPHATVSFYVAVMAPPGDVNRTRQIVGLH